MGLKEASALSSLGSAKVGDYISVADFSDSTKNALKESGLYDGVSDYIEVTS